MAKKKMNGFVGFILWLAVTLAILAVASGLIVGALAVPFIPAIVTVIAGWVIVASVVIGLVMKLMGMF